jgi:hypothetical protein
MGATHDISGTCTKKLASASTFYMKTSANSMWNNTNNGMEMNP